jgi:septum formation protein
MQSSKLLSEKNSFLPPSNEITGKTTLSILKNIRQDRRIILGSGSPRRLELIKSLGFNNIEVRVSGFEENLDRYDFNTAAEYCLETAIRKVASIANAINVNEESKATKTVIIGADTIVEINGQILEKPSSVSDAYRMLSTLSNSMHLVHTAVSIFTNVDKTVSADTVVPLSSAVSYVQTTKVKFVELSDEDIYAYIETGEPFDKAGGYGIQGFGGQFVEHIEGCYFNVMGLPVSSLSRQLNELYSQGRL